MGLGKTRIALQYLAQHLATLPAVIVCPASVKYHWQHECLSTTNLRATVLEGQTPSESTPLARRPKLVVLNFDILRYWLPWLMKLKPQTVIVDECFPWNTPILTNYGWLPIGLVVEGQLAVEVACYDIQQGVLYYRPILQYNAKRRSNRMVTIHHSKGTFVCTENHKIWTENHGYVRASELSRGDSLRVVREEINCSGAEAETPVLQSNMFQSVQQSQAQEVPQDNNLRVVREGKTGILPCKILQFQLLKQTQQSYSSCNRITQEPEGEKTYGVIEKENGDSQEGPMANPKRIVTGGQTIFEDDRKQSHESAGGSGKDEEDEGGEWDTKAMERGAGWEWKANIATEVSVGGFRRGVGSRIGYSNRSTKAEGVWLSDLLQGRYRPSSDDDCRGGGRASTLLQGKQENRREKTESTSVAWVESIEVHQFGNRSRHEDGAEKDSYVYNIEVKEFHNYFANRVLVKNCQYAANPNAKRTRALKALCKGVPHLLALSGTPLVNRPIELQPVLQLVRPDLFPSRWDYAHRYCAPKWTPWGWKYTGASNLPELHEVLSREVMVRRLKTDVLKELPPKTRSVIPVPLSDVNEYRRADLDFAAWLTRQDPAAARRALKAETLTKIGYLLRLAARLKLPFVIEWINEWLGDCDEKLVVFAVHRQMIEALREGCKARSVVVDGSVTGRRRHDVVRAFQNDRGIRLLIGNMQAAGVGITLTAASTVAFAEVAWRPGDHTQAEDRCYRIGTTEPVFIHYLVGVDTVEEKLCKLIQQKQEVISSVLDGKIGTGDLDVYNQLLRELRKGGESCDTD